MNAQSSTLEMLIYYSGRQAHKSLIIKQHGGSDGGEVATVGAMEAGNHDFSLGNLRMASQLKFSLLCETYSVVGTSDYSQLCSSDFHCLHRDGSIVACVLLHRESPAFIVAEMKQGVSCFHCCFH